MSAPPIVAICQYGGQFVTKTDGSLCYTGGEAHAIDIDRSLLFDDFKSEIKTVFNIDVNYMTIKYFLPNNKETLITVSCDKDMKRMIDFNANSSTVSVYILADANSRVTVAVLPDPVLAASEDRTVRHPKRTAAISTSGRLTRSRAQSDKTDLPEVALTVPADHRQRDMNAPESFTIRECTLPITDEGYSGDTSVFTAADQTTPQALALSANDVITGVGQEFENVKDFRDKLCQHAINKCFTYRFVKNDPIRATVKCTVDGCPWRLHASQSFQKKKFIIKKLNNVHTCGGGTGEGRSRVTKQWLVSILKEKLRDNPDWRPKEIAEDIHREYGVSLRYYQIWHGKAAAEKELINMHVEASNQLPWFCEKIRESNPGSVISLATSVDSKFRMFVSFHACLYGFEHGCRPLIFIDRIPLKTNNQLKLFVAASVDGDGGIFPIAFAAVEADTYDSSLWFLEQLKYALPASRVITFLSDRQNLLEEIVPKIFEDSYHSYCLNHLLLDFRAELKKGSWSEEMKNKMVNSFDSAAQSCLVEEFNAHVESIRTISSDAAKWVMDNKPEHWSNAFFKGSRYNHFSADIVEFNNWLSLKQESSVILIIDAICSKMIEVTCARRESSSKWTSTLTPSMEQELKKEVSRAHKFEVLCSSDAVFEVRGADVNVVNIGNWECTCRMWQITGLPCMHAIAVLDHLGKSLYDYCSKYFKLDCYHATYSESVHPIPDVERIVSFANTSLYPPRSRQLKWPRRKRDRRKGGEVRALHCSLCKGVGHNKATCEAAMSLQM